MNKLITILYIALSGFVNGQAYTSLTQSQNKLLDKYGISYTGLQTRYIMSTNQIDKISDIQTRDGMIESYNEFTKWNNGKLQVIPDTSIIIRTGTDYIKNKRLTQDSKNLEWLMNDSQTLLQMIHFDINRDNIKSIEILEFHLTGIKEYTYIFHMIFIEDFNNNWSSFSSDDNDLTLDCPFCTVP